MSPDKEPRFEIRRSSREMADRLANNERELRRINDYWKDSGPHTLPINVWTERAALDGQIKELRWLQGEDG